METSRHNPAPVPRHWHDVAYWGLMAMACVTFLVMNVLTTLKEDDLAFSLIEGVWTPVKTLSDLFVSHAHHYIDSNGRTANFVAALFCGLLGKTVFNVCNTLVFGVMAHLLSVLATGRRSVLALAMFLAMVGTCFPVPGETMLWLDGSCNYMWAITFTLALALYLQREHDSRMGWGKTCLLLLASVVAGSFNEATSFGFLAGWVLFYAFNRNRLDCRSVTVLAGYLLGILVIVCSPGAWQRAAAGDLVVNLPFAELLSSRWYIFFEKMCRFYLPVLALLLGLAVWLAKGFAVLRRSPWTWIFLSLALVMFALGVIHERAYAPLVTVAFIIVAMAADWLLRRLVWARLAAVILCVGLAAFTFARGIGVLKAYKAYDDRTVQEIREAPGQAILLQRQFDGYSRFVKPMNFNSSVFFGHEVIYCAYFDKENVQFVSDSVYRRYHEGRLLDGAVTAGLKNDMPDVVGEILAIPGQDFMAVELRLDTLPLTPQTARYYMSSTEAGMSPQELERRRNYGLITDYNPQGFFPIAYQGKRWILLPPMDDATSRIVFPLGYNESCGEVTLSR